MQRCILIGAGDCNVQKIETKPEDLVIAVDGGYDTCRKYAIVPDLIVGDFDSAQESDMPQIAEIAKIAPDHVVVLPTEKDDTDMLAAIRIGLLEGCQEFRIYGGMGGRLEHTLANLQCLIYLKQCSGEKASGVTIRNLKYEMQEVRLQTAFRSGFLMNLLENGPV